MHLKVFVKLKKTLKTLSSGQQNPKKPTGLDFFFFKNPGFFQPWSCKLKDDRLTLQLPRVPQLPGPAAAWQLPAAPPSPWPSAAPALPGPAPAAQFAAFRCHAAQKEINYVTIRIKKRKNKCHGIQCCGSGCVWATRIRIHPHLYGSGSFDQQANK